MNKVLLLGNLTKDVELKYTTGGLAIGKVSIATNRRWKDSATGETKEEAMFIDVNLFGRTAEIANQYLSKGKKVFIEGRLTFETWSDSNGKKRSKHSVTAESLQLIDSNRSNNDKEDEPTGTYKQDGKPDIPVVDKTTGNDYEVPF